MSELKVTQNDINTFEAYINDCMDKVAFGNTDWNHSYTLAKKSLEKQIPKDPLSIRQDFPIDSLILSGETILKCPDCGSDKLMRGYPCKCGQILNWTAIKNN